MLDPEDRSGNWSVGMANAWENSPYQGQGRLPNFTPTYSYCGKRLYIDTTDIGWHAIDNPRWQLDLYGSYRLDGFNEFSGDTTGGEPRPDDDPLKGLERSNAFEASVQLTRKLPLGRFALEARQDVSGVHDGAALRARWARVYRGSHWQVEPWAEFGWWSDQRADYYFGVRPDEASATRPAASVGSTTHWGRRNGAALHPVAAPSPEPESRLSPVCRRHRGQPDRRHDGGAERGDRLPLRAQ
jgi:outer membrane protein